MRPAAQVLTLLLACRAAAFILKSAGCQNEMDCSLGGRCVRGACQCYPMWQGERCERLALGQATDFSTNGYRNPDGPSWGGSVIRGDDGRYHMFVSYFSKDCGLSSWKFNSVIHHAVSSTPDGPYLHKREILHEFAHNPTITRAPNGTYLLYHIGETFYQRELSTYVKDCRAGHESKPNRSAQRSGATNFDGRIRIAYSDSLDGPWVLHNHGLPILQPSKGRHWDTVVTNPAPVFLPNGSVLLYYRGDDRFSPTFQGKRHRKIGVAFAKTWQGPYTRLSDQPITESGEDPFVFANSDGSGFHMIFENKFQGIVGQHAYSHDGLRWITDPKPLYDLRVDLASGGSTSLDRRERPQLLKDEQGEPIYLFNAVQGARQRGQSYSGEQATWTMATPLGQRLPAHPPTIRFEKPAE